MKARETLAACHTPSGRVTARQGTREVSRGVLRQPGFLDLHPPHVAGRTPIRPGWARRGYVTSGADVRGAQQCLTKDAPTEWQLDLPHTIGEQAIMSEALEAMRQDMEEKPSEKFDGLQRHGALPIPPLVVFPPKRHLAVATRQ